MTLPNQSNYQRIRNFLQMIERKPKKDVKYFFFEDVNKFVVNGTKLRNLPLYYHKHYMKSEFYVHIDISTKVVQFYSFDMPSLMNGRRTNEVQGTIPWDIVVEDSIYSFFLNNIKELTSETFPFSQATDNKPYTPTFNDAKPNYPAHTTYPHTTYPQTTYPSYSTYSSYGSPTYKEREAFLDKLRDLQRGNSFTKTVDYVDEALGKLLEEKKLEVIDDILRVVFIDKMAIPLILEILSITKNVEGTKEWSPFYKRAKEHITKVNPQKAEMVLKLLD